ncbi:uncharacterized protein LOC110705758 [Chenopodium quinoa]|uniref:uncharacterized protein LOC110705758 n=1 Tax=Chenopodium quinoa TaxID=63459 RepID=UPI000B781D64|nr:uncharacterized protein LOC110705758 [Chenopodium quinoa]
MKTQLLEKEWRAKQSDLLLRRQLRPINMASSQSFSQPQRFGHDLQEDYENHMGSNECNLEQYVDEKDEFSDDLSTLTPMELGMQDEPLMNEEHETEKIGPDDKIINTFTRFLGTLARNSSLALLNKISCHYVPDKEQIWSYVKKKYIILEKGKDCVLSSVGRLWRRYKCSVKATNFTLYENDDDRLANPPNTIPEAHFKEWLEFWNLEPVQGQDGGGTNSK